MHFKIIGKISRLAVFAQLLSLVLKRKNEIDIKSSICITYLINDCGWQQEDLPSAIKSLLLANENIEMRSQ